MAKTKIIRSLDVSELTAKANSVQPGPDIYANHIQIVVSQFEVFLDLYRLAPMVKNIHGTDATHLQRVIVPHSIVKSMIQALQQVVDAYEQATGVAFPNYSQPEETVDSNKDTPDA